MTTTVAPESRLARLVTDWLDPKTWIIAVSLITGWTADRWTGLGWGAVSTLFAAVIPVLIIKRGVQTGRWADRHLGVKSSRLTVMALILTSVAIGITIMLLGGAPAQVVALTVAMIATLAGLAAITPAWKISVHTAVAAGATTMLAGQLPLIAVVVLWLVVAAVGWSRVAVRGHAPAQVLAGGALGILIAGLVFTALS
jgi:membrane-associated phospholipid phosphatase